MSVIIRSIFKLSVSCLLLCLISCQGETDTKISKASILPTITKSSNLVDNSFFKAKRKIGFTSSIRSIFQDSKGHFWFGSQSEGVCLFDGRDFKYFTSKDGLANDQVRTIQEDNKGNIWFCTQDGISFYDGYVMTTITDIKSYQNHRYYDRNGLGNPTWKSGINDLWFDGGANNGVLRWDGTDLHFLPFPVDSKGSIHMEHDDMAMPYYVFSISKDRDGKIWFGTMSRGVVCYDPNKAPENQFVEYAHHPNGLSLVRSIYHDNNGHHWFGDNGAGLYKLENSKLVHFSAKYGVESKHYLMTGKVMDSPGTLARIWSINQDLEGNYWFATIDSGIWKFDGETLENLLEKDNLPSNSVEEIYKDKEGRLWFGFSTGEVLIYHQGKFSAFDFDNC